MMNEFLRRTKCTIVKFERNILITLIANHFVVQTLTSGPSGRNSSNRDVCGLISVWKRDRNVEVFFQSVVITVFSVCTLNVL